MIGPEGAEGRDLQDGVDVLHLPVQLVLGGQSMIVEGYVSVWLCPSCPKVHLSIEIGPNTAMNIQLTDLEAETLGKALISPQPINPKHLRSAK